MVELSVGEVSGLIAAGVFVLQILLALIFPVALVGFVGEENTAVTWSVLGRSLQSSPWPTLLQTDAAASHGVRRRVTHSLTFQTVIVYLVSLAAIVTPLGLYQTVEPENPYPEAFRFVKDESPFGYGTPPRLEGPFARNCGNDPCPGSWKNVTCVQQGLLQNCTGAVFGRAIPRPWTTTLRDGANRVAQSVSSIFDIQWRSQMNASDGLGESGWFLKSGYRQIGMLILEPTIQLVDGLVVDAQSGGIGFRNHTAPVPVHEDGSTWEEDILFIEPEAQCVDLNVTFDFKLSSNTDNKLVVTSYAFVDRGGLSALPRMSPNLSISAFGNGQGALDLRERAYKAAWANNFLTLAYLNRTDPDPTNITRWDVTPGMKFYSTEMVEDASKINGMSPAGDFVIDHLAIRSTMDYGEYLSFSTAAASNKLNSTNPFGISRAHFDLVSEICAGGDGANFPNINSSLIACGLQYGTARRTDGGSEVSPQPGSAWTLPVYSCAASVRATIRTVTFRYNGTGLAALNATSAPAKSYPSLADQPLWAVESIPFPAKISNVQPLWGILGLGANTTTSTAVPPSLAANLTAYRGPFLNLPGILTSTLSPLHSYDYVDPVAGQNLPGVDFYVQALINAFNIIRPGSAGYAQYADYSGLTSLALVTKWRALLGAGGGNSGRVEDGGAATAGKVLQLVWTDIAANAVVGTKGWGLRGGEDQGGEGGNGVKRRDDSGKTGGANEARVLVTAYKRRVRYHLLYMIPAILVLVLSIIVLIAWIVLLLLGRTGLAKMRRLLDATSPGRILGGFLWPGHGATLRETNEWVKHVGTKVVVVGRGPGESLAVADQEAWRDEHQLMGGRQGAVGEETIELVPKGDDKPGGAVW
ncbi:uncharacterized protein C8A04DRAFT_15115 [Dichotomopilus funicola]|uniref:Uncharacterized protein n=1 Tax=Dichotomopilus funicola TaxID=1934379 RepID=A0AAN6ZIA6_9PEZI|nr:hypothetical protein C8A04DRAFT_15115 [Dichotomopilus funicola]